MASVTWLFLSSAVLFALMESHSPLALTCNSCTNIKENHLCDESHQGEELCGMGFPFCTSIHMSISKNGQRSEHDVLRCATARECEQQPATSAVSKSCCNTDLCNKIIS